MTKRHHLNPGWLDRANRSGNIVVLAWLLSVAMPARTRAESRADYRYEDYSEEGGRIHIRTHGFYFNEELKPWLAVQGNYIYDGISGATPTGAPPLPGQNTVRKVNVSDIRRAGFLQAAIQLGDHTLSPQVSYSEESDYRSTGISLSDAIAFNEKNTTLSLGISHSFDQILPNEGEDPSITSSRDKDTTDVLFGVSQLIGPNTVLGANLTLGYSDGYLSDPYKRVLFDDFPYYPGTDPADPFPYTVWPEKRPSHKFRQVVYLSLQHYVEKANGAIDASYRFHHDDFGIIANTLSLQWNQKIGKRVMVSPLFRYHTQTEADFYATHFPGDPSDPESFPTPRYYSADYRLSALDSFTYGIGVSVRVHKHASLEFAYKRYEMQGTDHVTSADQYPKANVFTGGFTLWW